MQLPRVANDRGRATRYLPTDNDQRQVLGVGSLSRRQPRGGANGPSGRRPARLVAELAARGRETGDAPTIALISDAAGAVGVSNEIALWRVHLSL